jgi:putative ABC transport system permease protein
MSLSMVLLIGAVLLLESFSHLQHVNPGFDPRHALTMRIALPASRYHGDTDRAQFIRSLVERIETIPGVTSASASTGLPMSAGLFAPFLAEGQQEISTGMRPIGQWNPVSPGYFKATGVPIVAGRAFTWSDELSAPPRVIVSQSLARKYWPNENPIGKHLTYARRQILAEVVGVAGDVKERALDSDMGIIFYTPYPQFTWPNVSLVIRAAGDPGSVAIAARDQVFALDRDMPVTGVEKLEDYVGRSLTGRRDLLYLIGAFAALALMLALIGLYGLMAFAVAQRTAEIGIRQAVGATPSDILRMVFRQALRLSVAGILVGAVAAFFVTRVITSMLYGVRATDPWTFAATSLLFIAVAALASYLPARRAMRIDPVEALRL